MTLQNMTLSPSSCSASGDHKETHLTWNSYKWATFCKPFEYSPTKHWKHRMASIQPSPFVFHEDLSHQSFDLRLLEVRQSPGPVYSKSSVPNVKFSKWVSSRPHLLTWGAGQYHSPLCGKGERGNIIKHWHFSPKNIFNTGLHLSIFNIPQPFYM